MEATIHVHDGVCLERVQQVLDTAGIPDYKVRNADSKIVVPVKNSSAAEELEDIISSMGWVTVPEDEE